MYLKEAYHNWRVMGVDLDDIDQFVSYNSEDVLVRQDFSFYASLPEIIGYQKMKELEDEYNKINNVSKHVIQEEANTEIERYIQFWDENKNLLVKISVFDSSLDIDKLNEVIGNEIANQKRKEGYESEQILHKL